MSEQVKDMLLQFQQFQQQFQNVLIQKENAKMMIMEMEKTSEELKDSKEDVYKVVGNVLIKSTPSKIKKQLSDEKETLDVRIKSLEKQETSLREKLTGLQSKLETSLKDTKTVE